MSRAVGDGGATVSDGDELGAVSGRDGVDDGVVLGSGRAGQESSSNGETHLEGCNWVRENGSDKRMAESESLECVLKEWTTEVKGESKAVIVKRLNGLRRREKERT